MKLFARSQKKGSLEISINAIVILVMAMVVLALGLTFIRNMIGKGQEEFGRIIDNSQLQNPADPQNPLTVDRQVEFKLGSSGELNVGWYNDLGVPAQVKPGAADGSVRIECLFEDGGGEYFKLVAPSVEVGGGESQAWVAIVKPEGSDVSPGTYTCPLSIVAGAGAGVEVKRSGSFTIKIRS